MPYKHNEKLLVWASDVDGETLAQAARTATMPFIFRHVALMPDAHLGKGATVGSVIPTKGAIIPAAVGVDIGCGMIAVRTNIHRSELSDEQLAAIRDEIRTTIPSGTSKAHAYANSNGDKWLRANPPSSRVDKKGWEKAAQQFGTLGSGNHFVEVSVDADDMIWAVLHSGSRGIGNMLASYHIKVAQAIAEKYMIQLPERDLAYLIEGTEKFDAYWEDLMWAQAYALANREEMMDALLTAIGNAVGGFSEVGERVNCHHNFTARENHFGENILVSRKGAIRAREGDMGIIPGSMGTSTFITRGLGNKASFMSSAHGAGRRLSRSAAKRELDVESLKAYMKGRVWLDDQADSFVDEHPESYKDVFQVMRDQIDLVEIVEHLNAVMNYKGAK